MKLTPARLAFAAFFAGSLAVQPGCAALFGTDTAAPTEQPANGAAGKPSDEPPSGSAAATAASAQPTEASVDAPKILSLAEFEFPVTLELPPETPKSKSLTHTGGIEIGDLSTAAKLTIYKADAKMKTIAQAKARKRIAGCDAQPVVKEGPDHYIYICKMRSMQSHVLLMLREVGGTVYACESRVHAETADSEELETQRKICATLKGL